MEVKSLLWTQDRRRDWNRHPGGWRLYRAKAGPVKLAIFGSEKYGWICHTHIGYADNLLPVKKLRRRNLAGAQDEATIRLHAWVAALALELGLVDVKEGGAE